MFNLHHELSSIQPESQEHQQSINTTIVDNHIYFLGSFYSIYNKATVNSKSPNDGEIGFQ